jgi:hypothetical protein
MKRKVKNAGSRWQMQRIARRDTKILCPSPLPIGFPGRDSRERHAGDQAQRLFPRRNLAAGSDVVPSSSAIHFRPLRRTREMRKSCHVAAALRIARFRDARYLPSMTSKRRERRSIHLSIPASGSMHVFFKPRRTLPGDFFSSRGLGRETDADLRRQGNRAGCLIGVGRGKKRKRCSRRTVSRVPQSRARMH